MKRDLINENTQIITSHDMQIDEIIEDLNMLALESEYLNWDKKDIWPRIKEISEDLEKLKIGW